jgi:aspartate kinase
MELIVQKYGGSSVANADRIRTVAERVARRRAAGCPMVIVVSAMGDTTDELIELARRVTQPVPSPDRAPGTGHQALAVLPEREMDVLLSTGEIVSSTLMAMALGSMGVPAISFSGFQAGIQTDQTHGRARILKVDPRRIHQALAEGQVAIVAGFQGTTPEIDVTTLGRGGSDTTAVALAAALHARCCEIYTDVEGVYTADPRIEPKARKLDEIGYEEMLEMASQGARVMHPRAVELGAIYDIPILVAHSQREAPGTFIRTRRGMEPTNKVRGISDDLGIAKVTVRGIPDRPGIAASIFETLAAAGLTVDAIVQNSSVERLADLSFTIAEADLPKALQIVRPVLDRLGSAGVVTDEHVGKVSIVGTGVLSTPGYVSRMFRALHDAGINIELITTSEIRITCIIAADRVPDAVRALHAAFELETPEAEALAGAGS